MAAFGTAKFVTECRVLAGCCLSIRPKPAIEGALKGVGYQASDLLGIVA